MCAMILKKQEKNMIIQSDISYIFCVGVKSSLQLWGKNLPYHVYHSAEGVEGKRVELA